MAASGKIRPAIVGLLASFLIACGGGDDTQETEIADKLPPPQIEQQADIGRDTALPAPVEPEETLLPGKSPDRTEAETAPVSTAAAPATMDPALPVPAGMTVGSLPTVEPRQPCGGSPTCVNAGSISGGHGAPGIEIYYDPERNDAIVRWGNALGGIVACADGGNTLGACVAAAAVEQSCKDEFVRLSGLADELAAFDAVFLTAGGPCRPEDGQP